MVIDFLVEGVSPSLPRSSFPTASFVLNFSLFSSNGQLLPPAFIEKVLAADAEAGRYKIITCGEEKHLAYNRVRPEARRTGMGQARGLTRYYPVQVGLTDFFETRQVSSLYLNHPEWYAAQDAGRL
jgi:hypothetical protein